MSATVQISSGQLRGGHENGVHVFRGIPYAAPVSGANRFRPPQPVEPWSGVRDASVNGQISLQVELPPPFGQPLPPAGPDCLNLNVWTPDPSASGLPVFVWIHGGAFYGGSGIEHVYDGASFARNGVVCVTINYRLGAQGFLHLADHFPQFADSGNCGLLDQIEALRWVKKNISAFGGDPNRVTIAGESAGGMSVTTILATPSAKGLFQQAIPQSGAGHNGISAPTASRIAGVVLSRLGVAPGDIDALNAVSDEKLLEVQVALIAEAGSTRDPEIFGEAAPSTMPFQPVYGTFVLPQQPISAVAAGSAADVSMLIGTTKDESVVFVVAMAELFNEGMVKGLLQATFGDAEKGEAAFRLYQSNRPGALPFQITGAVESDRMFIVPALRLAEAQTKYNKNVWMYRFDWGTPIYDGMLGACHALELAFVFNNLKDPRASYLVGPDGPQQLADNVHSAWVNFTKNGSPEHSGIPTWPRFDSQRRPTMLFDMECKVVDRPNEEEVSLWAGIL
ncbi:MAG: Carboxylesterase [Actinomycetota bacterium]|jgi:para-nitrobenzyl esterase